MRWDGWDGRGWDEMGWDGRGWDGTHNGAGHRAGMEPVSSGVTCEVGIGIMSLSQEKELV